MNQQISAEQEERRYYVDPLWYEERGLSFNDVVQDRFCASCRRRIGTEEEERFTNIDRKTGRVSFEMRKVPFGSNPIRVIRNHCRTERTYITPEMPTLEVVFRILLANGNQPMPIEHIREQMAEWCPHGGCRWLQMPLEMLERIVRSDTAYGIRQHQLAAVA